jgi:hypothetical protein
MSFSMSHGLDGTLSYGAAKRKKEISLSSSRALNKNEGEPIRNDTPFIIVWIRHEATLIVSGSREALDYLKTKTVASSTTNCELNFSPVLESRALSLLVFADDFFHYCAAQVSAVSVIRNV